MHLHDHRQAVEGEDRRAQGLRRRGHRLPDQRRSGGSALVLFRVVASGKRSPERLEGQPVRQPLEHGRALRADRPGDLGADRGRVTHLVVGVGTGGTISGVGRYLKEQNPRIKVWGIDTYGSVFKKYKETGVFDKNEIYPYITEGIGEDFLPRNVDFDVIDHFEKVTDKDAALMTRRIAREEGIFAGNSAGSAMAGLRQLKEHFTAADVIVVIFHDHGSRYLGKMFNDEWMRQKGFLEKTGMTARDLVASGLSGELLSIESSEPVEAAARLMAAHDFSQISIRSDQRLVGSLNETHLYSGWSRIRRSKSRPVETIMQPAFAFVDISTPVELLSTMITPSDARRCWFGTSRPTRRSSSPAPTSFACSADRAATPPRDPCLTSFPPTSRATSTRSCPAGRPSSKRWRRGPMSTTSRSSGPRVATHVTRSPG